MEEKKMNRLCRTCLREDGVMKSLFNVRDETNQPKLRLCQLLMSSTCLQITEHDGLPSLICETCERNLFTAHTFKYMCEQSDSILRRYIILKNDSCVNKITNDEMFVDSEVVKNETQLVMENNIDSWMFFEDSPVKVEKFYEMDQNIATYEMDQNIATYDMDEKKDNICEFDLHLDKFTQVDLDHVWNINNCPYCQKKFQSSNGLRLHIKRHMKMDVNICSECGLIFASEESFNKHKLEVHGASTVMESTSSEYQESNQTNDKENDLKEQKSQHIKYNCDDCGTKFTRSKYKCDVCKKRFCTKSKLTTHTKKVHPVKEEIYDDEVTVNNKNCDTNNLVNNQYDIISTEENWKDSLVIKEETLNELLEDPKSKNVSQLKKKPFKCDLCRKCFIKKHNLERHISSVHIMERNHKFDNDTKEFSTEMICPDTGAILYKCQICTESFKSNLDLKEHNMNIHNEDKPFLCTLCGNRFTRNYFLMIHMRRHRGEKPFKCKYCEKAFARTSDVLLHERYHTGEKTHLCTVCGKGFQRKCTLEIHMRVHSGEKPYLCPHCGKGFSQRNDIKAHVRRHTGERFKCELCDRGFVHRHLLTKHKMKVHGIDCKAQLIRMKKNEIMEQQNNLRSDVSMDTTPAENLKLLSEPQTQMEEQNNLPSDVLIDTTHAENLKLLSEPQTQMEEQNNDPSDVLMDTTHAENLKLLPDPQTQMNEQENILSDVLMDTTHVDNLQLTTAPQIQNVLYSLTYRKDKSINCDIVLAPKQDYTRV